MEKKLTLTVKEAAEMLGISEYLAYEAVNKGIIPHIRIGRRIIIPYHNFEKWLENSCNTAF
jgi:excisionase family DNA binding protein